MSHCSPSLSTCPATGSVAPPGACQTRLCLKKLWGQIMISRVGTMASTAKPPYVDTCPYTSWFNSYTERPNLLPCRSTLFLTGNLRESSDASTVSFRPNCLTCGTNTRPMNSHPSGCWKPALTWMYWGTRPITQTNKKQMTSLGATK